MKRSRLVFTGIAVAAVVSLYAWRSWAGDGDAAEGAGDGGATIEREYNLDPDLLRRVKIGLKIAPVPLNLAGQNVLLVGLGSYIVNAQGGCNDCHTNPPYASGGNPFLGQPKQINVAGYLAGGMQFGPGIVSRNLTPENGLPAGRTYAEFKQQMRTGIDLDDPNGSLLQVMPWPVYQSMTDRDLRAIYAYLSTIPSITSDQ